MAAAGEIMGGVDPLPGDIGVEEPYHLETGHYVFLCSIPGHYQQGMIAEMTSSKATPFRSLPAGSYQDPAGLLRLGRGECAP